VIIYLNYVALYYVRMLCYVGYFWVMLSYVLVYYFVCTLF